MKNKDVLLVAFITFSCFTNLHVNAQTSEPAFPFKVTADLVIHYVWQGSMATGSPTPNFQSALAYSKEKFEIGVWGSTDFVVYYKEFDPYVSLIAGHFKLAVTDYNWNFGQADYFNTINGHSGY